MSEDQPRLEDQRDNVPNAYVIPSYVLAMYFAKLAAKKEKGA